MRSPFHLFMICALLVLAWTVLRLTEGEAVAGVVMFSDAALVVGARCLLKPWDERLFYSEFLRHEIDLFDAELETVPFTSRRTNAPPRVLRLYEEAVAARAEAQCHRSHGRLRDAAVAIETAHSTLAELYELEDAGPVSLLEIDDTPPLHVIEGKGDQRLKLPGDLPERVVVQVEHPSSGHRRSTYTIRNGRNGPDISHFSASGERSRRLVNLRGHRRLQVRAEGRWIISFQTARALPRVKSKLAGNGDEVVLYNGPKAIIDFTHDNDRPAPFTMTRADLSLAQWEGIADSHRGVTVVPGPCVLAICTEGDWHLTLSPVTDIGTAVRHFDTSLQGADDQVVLYTGPTGDISFANLGEDAFQINRLTPELTKDTELVRVSGGHQGTLHLESCTILQILTQGGGWTLEAAT